MGYRDDVLGVLRAARALLAAGNWTRGCYARTVTGRQISSFAPDAVAWCAVGAIHRAAGEARVGRVQQWAPVSDGAVRALAAASNTLPVGWNGADAEGYVTGANDDEATSLADVLRWYDGAIARESLDAWRASQVAAVVLGELGSAAALAVAVAVFHATVALGGSAS